MTCELGLCSLCACLCGCGLCTNHIHLARWIFRMAVQLVRCRVVLARCDGDGHECACVPVSFLLRACAVSMACIARSFVGWLRQKPACVGVGGCVVDGRSCHSHRWRETRNGWCHNARCPRGVGSGSYVSVLACVHVKRVFCILTWHPRFWWCASPPRVISLRSQKSERLTA